MIIFSGSPERKNAELENAGKKKVGGCGCGCGCEYDTFISHPKIFLICYFFPVAFFSYN
jgi:hypothetical protein